jgi:hypothetical protein
VAGEPTVVHVAGKTLKVNASCESKFCY